MTTIEIDFDDYKRLTLLRHNEHDTYARVVKRLLDGVDNGSDAPEIDHKPSSNVSGFWIKRVHLPDGTELSAYYMHKTYYAKIVGNEWVSEDGNTYKSASSAAGAITGNNVNGLRFWSAKKPGTIAWRRLDSLIPS